MMKTQCYITFLLVLLTCTYAVGQPYQIDTSQPEPEAIILFDDPENEGVKLGSYEGTIGTKAQRFFIKDYSEYQPVDIFLFSRTKGKELEIGLVLATWNDRQQSCKTASEGYCQLKFRNYGGIGFDIKGDSGSEFTVMIVVGKEVLPEFASPFYKVSENELNKLEDTAGNTENDPSERESSNSLILYIIAFFLLLIVILLAIMLLRRNGGVKLLMIIMLSSSLIYAQDTASEETSTEETESERRDRLTEEIKAEVKAEFERYKKARERLDGFEGALGKIEELRKIKSDYDSFISAYEGLGRCIAGAPSFSSPRIPSFCDYDYSTGVSGLSDGSESCASCFQSARTQFNEVRFTLARLETIYKCTKEMTTSAKAFGDSFSSATKSGLGWTSARKNIEASEKKLEDAYDKKYTELMRKLHSSLIEMSICEAKYGLSDWYDRFGFVYYEFMADRYRRSK